MKAPPDRRAVTIALPAPRLAPAVVDPAASRVVGRERGLLNRIAAVFRDSPTSEQEVYQLAQARLNAATKASDLARRGQENTRQMLTTLGHSLISATSQSPLRRCDIALTVPAPASVSWPRIRRSYPDSPPSRLVEKMHAWVRRVH